MLTKIRVMRKLTKAARMQADSLPEIRKGLDRMAFDYGDERVGNRPVSEGHIINAALLLMMSLPEPERAAAAKASFEKMNALLALDEPEPWQIEAIIKGENLENPAEEQAGERQGSLVIEGNPEGTRKVGRPDSPGSAFPRKRRPG